MSKFFINSAYKSYSQIFFAMTESKGMVMLESQLGIYNYVEEAHLYISLLGKVILRHK